MINTFRKYTGVIFAVTLLISCGGSDTPGETPIEPPVDPVNLPAKSIGTLPVNGEPCSEFEEVANDELKVSILFNWNNANFAQTYQLRVFESQTLVFNETTSLLQASVILDKGKSYSWSITTKNEDGETAGDTYSFTTPGNPVGNYVPYAAAISIDFNTTTSEMDISWIGNDEDGDILTYDVIVKEENEIIEEFLDLEIDSLNPIVYTAEALIEVEVISKDSFGNFSISRVTTESPE